MVQKMLDYDAKQREELEAYEAKVQEVVAKKKEELQAKTGAELKGMLTAEGLPAGVGKEDRIQRLVEVAKKSGQIDKCLAQASHDARRKELEAMEKSDLLKLCQQKDADPFVKEVLVERILSYEDESGETIGKKARASK